MAPVFRRFNHPSTWLILAGVAVGCAAFMAHRGLTHLARLTPRDAAHDATPRAAMALSAVPVRALAGTTVFAAAQPMDGRPDQSAPAQRFRLAGTFFVLSADLQPATRKAVLVNRQTGQDIIVQEGDRFADDLTVLAVAANHVLLDYRGQHETIELTTGMGQVTRAGGPAGTADSTAGDRDAPESRFGDQIADNRWVFERDQLITYYQDVMQSPRRLKQVFDSMKPLYDSDRKITGYHLDIEGEPDFFREVGLRQGDVVRHVNDMAMSSRLRAEYLIREFVYDRLNVFVIDIERDNEPLKLVYEIR